MKFINNKGSALPLVIIFMVVLALLGAALWGFAVNEAKGAAWQVNSTQAHYLARSGVHAGIKILQEQLNSGTYTEMPAVITALNNHISGLAASNFEITDVGSYTIHYEQIDSQTIKILSVGTAAGSNKTVSLTTRLSFPASSVVNPNEWVAGINLIHSVNTFAYLGKGVTLEGKPIRSPQGGTVPSTFYSSSILFTDYDNHSLVQINNSVNITFDSEVLFFQTDIELNSLPVTTKNGVFFNVSDAVVSNRPSGILAYGSPVGFEDVGRYSSFISSMSGGNDYSGWYTDDPVLNPNTYPFITGVRYGVVYFGGDVTGYGPDIGEGYYFFASDPTNGITNGVNLKEGNLITNNKLIPIQSDDRIIKAIEAMFKYTLGSTEARMWDSK